LYFDSHEDVKLVGTAARDGGDPDRTFFQIKRHMDDPDDVVKIDGKEPGRRRNLRADPLQAEARLLEDRRRHHGGRHHRACELQ